MRKICFIASSGGHLEEISRLKKVANSVNSFLVTERSDFNTDNFINKKYYVPQTNRRELLFFLKFIYLFMKALMIMIKEKPEYIITTGALIAYPFCMTGKLFGCKIIYIESFARVNHGSLTGKLLYKHSDLFIVQWDEMLNIYPNAVLGGGIF